MAAFIFAICASYPISAIAGIAGEGIGLFRTSQLSGELIASLEEQSNRTFERAVKAEGNAESARATAKGFEARIAEANRASAEANARAAGAELQLAEANRKAGEANQKAESFRRDIAKANERAANVEVATGELKKDAAKEAAARAPRHAGASEAKLMSPILAPFKGRKLTIGTWREFEPVQLANDLILIFRQVGLDVPPPFTFLGGVAVPGINLEAHKDSEDFAEAVAKALSLAGLVKPPVPLAIRNGLQGEVEIVIGPKP